MPRCSRQCLQVSIVEASIEAAVWYRLGWTDDRLIWNATAWGVDMLTFAVEPNSAEWSEVPPSLLLPPHLATLLHGPRPRPHVAAGVDAGH